MFTNLNLTDMETCYKVFRREVHPVDRRSRRTASASSRRSRPRSPRGGWRRLRGRHLATRAAPTPRARRSAGATALRAVYGVVRYSGVWRRVREPSRPRRPTASVPPAEFDDADAELADVLRLARRSRRTTPTGSTRLVEPHLGQRRARDRRRPRRADRAAARERSCDRDRPVEAFRRASSGARFAGKPEVDGRLGDIAALGRRHACTTPSSSSTCSSTSTTMPTPWRTPRVAAPGRPAVRVRARVRRSVLELRPAHRAPAPLPPVAARLGVRPRRASRSWTRVTSTRSARSSRGGSSPVSWARCRPSRGRCRRTTGSSSRRCGESRRAARPGSASRCSASAPYASRTYW